MDMNHLSIFFNPHEIEIEKREKVPHHEVTITLKGKKDLPYINIFLPLKEDLSSLIKQLQKVEAEL